MYIHKIILMYKGAVVNMSINMNIHKEKILKLIRLNRVVTSSELAKHLGISWNTAEKYLLELVIEGRIEKIKKEGVNLWLLKS